MIWLTWRQSRLQAASAAVVLAAFAVLLAVTEPQLAGMYAGSRIGSCRGVGCIGPASDFLLQLYVAGTYWLLYLLGIAVILGAPALICIFWGAPLVAREFEAGTHYLAWNQSITRTRWLAVKITLIGLAAMAVSEALSLMQAWWAAPFAKAAERGGSGLPIDIGQFSPLVFATHGITPAAYSAFAFVLGVSAGVVIRRAVPAMAITLVIFAAVQVAMPLWIRPHLFPPDRTITSFSSVSDIKYQVSTDLSGKGTFTFAAGHLSSQPGAWVLSSGAVNEAGNPVSTIPAACMQLETGDLGVDCLASHGIRVAVTYQPASRYWPFQWTETAIYLALAVTLAGYCFWRLRRRIA